MSVTPETLPAPTPLSTSARVGAPGLLPALAPRLARAAAQAPIRIGLRAKLLAAIAAACATVMVLTVVILALQFRAVESAARLEAHNLARALAYGATQNLDAIQPYVEGLDQLYQRDLFILDRERRTLADVRTAELGQIYRGDTGGEVGRTMLDGQMRAFMEFSDQHPTGARLLVVPLRDGAHERARIIGALVLEYTGIYAQLFEADSWVLYLVGIAGLGATILIALLGLRISGTMLDRVGRLQRSLNAFSQGHHDTRVDTDSRDEIGDLSRAFNAMAADLQHHQHELMLETAMAKEAARQVEYLAYTDKLTGLANRSQFSRSMEQALADAERQNRQLALFFIDLDRFKNINDTLGHAAGDRLLKEVAERLKACLRASDRIARLGGDEFVVLATSVESAERLGSLARKILAAVAQPLQLEGNEFRVTASIGISLYPEDGRDERALMKHADIAMYQAKEDGKNNFAFYAPDLNRHSLERLALETELQRAFEDGQLELHYQPKVDATSGRILGVEALMRWRHPDLGCVSPAKFIPVAEETGLIVPLGRWAMEQACRQQVEWLRQGLPALKMAVNLSPRQFADDALLDDLKQILAATGIAPECLELEITEGMLMRNVEKASELLASCKRLGVQLAVDDFGTGYSSLSNLKRFPIDTLKIDRSFVRELGEEGETCAVTEVITQAIITMGKSLDMTVVAEGVETATQAEFLRERGCDQLQGYYFGKALPARVLADMFGATQPRGWPTDWPLSWPEEAACGAATALH